MTKAIRGAARRLAKPQCQALLTEFKDAVGRSLRENLDAEGLAAPEYLGRVFWYEAQESNCHSERVAYTTPGNRAIFVCSRRLRSLSKANGSQVEIAVIHEALHTLGLGENPPTPDEITRRVLANCRD